MKLKGFNEIKLKMICLLLKVFRKVWFECIGCDLKLNGGKCLIGMNNVVSFIIIILKRRGGFVYVFFYCLNFKLLIFLKG